MDQPNKTAQTFKIGDVVGDLTTELSGTVKQVYNKKETVYLIGNRYYCSTENLVLIKGKTN